MGNFDAISYLDEFFGITAGNISIDARLLLHYCSRLVREHELQGSTVLSLGCGPSICEVLNLAGVASAIHMSDISEANRVALEQRDSPDALGFDWRPLFAQALAEERNPLEKMLEGDAYRAVGANAVTERVNRLNKCLTLILPCDVTRADPLEGRGFSSYDIVISLFCVDAASRDLPTWQRCFKNMCDLVAPNGLLTFGTSLESSAYKFGDQIYESAFVTEEMVLDALRSNGFSLVAPDIVRFEEDNPERIYSGGVYLTAQKTLV